MATIRERKAASGSVSYHVQVRLRGFPPQSATFPRKTDARTWAASVESSLRERRYMPHLEAQKHTAREALDRYEREVLPRKRPGTVYTQSRQLAWWRDHIGDMRLCDVTPSVIVEMRTKMLTQPRRQGGQRSGASWNRYLALLRHVLATAEREWMWIESNPARRVKMEKESRGKTRWLEADERASLLKSCREGAEPRLLLIVTLALATAMRRSEIRFLRWSEVNLKARRITLPPERSKNGRERVVPLSKQAAELLTQHGRVRRIDSDYVFPGQESASGIEPLDFRNEFEKAVKAAGLKDVSFHTLRHTALSVAAMAGANTRELMDFGGHLSVATSARYQHLAAEHVADLAERVSAEVFG